MNIYTHIYVHMYIYIYITYSKRNLRTPLSAYTSRDDVRLPLLPPGRPEGHRYWGREEVIARFCS